MKAVSVIACLAFASPALMACGGSDVGFFLSDGSSSPVCANGTWFEQRPEGI